MIKLILKIVGILLIPGWFGLLVYSIITESHELALVIMVSPMVFVVGSIILSLIVAGILDAIDEYKAERKAKDLWPGSHKLL